MERFTNLTQYERVSLGQRFNLADGHARQYRDEVQRTFGLDPMYEASGRASQSEVERAFQSAFYLLAGQNTAIEHPHTLLCTSASLATDLLATHLSGSGLTVSLLQPCFDNLALILQRRRVAMTPLAEDELSAARLATTIETMASDALFLALPNNPTGFILDESSFARLASLCAANGKLLILDWTFRFFSDSDRWDQYEILARSGVSYVCIEDTGKTWPTLDLKCSILATSPDLYGKVLDVHNDVLLNVSPFTLLLLTEYINDTLRRGLDVVVRDLVSANRRRLSDALAGSVLSPTPGQVPLSVEWVRIDSTAIQAVEVVKLHADRDIGILPGDNFFWDSPRLGSGFVRFALARDPQTFAAACDRIKSLVADEPRLWKRTP